MQRTASDLVGRSQSAIRPQSSLETDCWTHWLVDGRAVVINGSIFNGKVPGPFQAPRDGVTNKSLFAVQAWRMDNASSSTAKTVSLDQETLVSFTTNLTNGGRDGFPPTETPGFSWHIGRMVLDSSQLAPTLSLQATWLITSLKLVVLR